MPPKQLLVVCLLHRLCYGVGNVQVSPDKKVQKDFVLKTSLAAKVALAHCLQRSAATTAMQHRLQRSTTCKIKNGHQGAQKWQPRSNPW